MESDQIWNQVAKFMQQLRGENLSKKSIIQIPGQKNAKNELEKIQAIGKERMKHMKENEQRIIQKWIECLEDNASGLLSGIYRLSVLIVWYGNY